MWSLPEILRPITHQFVSFDTHEREAHATKGLDALPEVQLHPLIAQAFAHEPLGALREARYPTAKTERPSQTQRDRCDLVLTPETHMSLFDPVQEQREVAKAEGTLFAPVAQTRTPTANEADPSLAYWIEIKAVPQFRYVDGVPIPNSNYATELTRWLRADVIKLASDPLIMHAGVLVVLFNELEEAGEHDLMLAVRGLIDAELPVGVPEIEKLPIADHAGNAWCTLGLVPVRL